MAPTMRAASLERVVRIAFGVLVVPFFGSLSLFLAYARSTRGDGSLKSAPVDILLVAVILFFALIATYGLDQLLAGIRPSRRRWFIRAERRLERTLDHARGRGSLTLGHLWGAPVRVHWSVALGLVLVAGFQPGAWCGFLAVILAHEFGHAVLVRRFGQRVIALSFYALGGECHWIGRPAAARRALIAWGGLAGQAVLLAIALGAGILFPTIFTGWFGEPLQRALVHSNLVMAAFNLLPIPPLDGAAAWRLLSRRARRSGPARSRDAVTEAVGSALERARRPPE